MKYVLMYTSTPELDASADPAAAEAVYKRVYEWFGANAGVMADSGAELLGIETATSVKFADAGPVVVDVACTDGSVGRLVLPSSEGALERHGGLVLSPLRRHQPADARFAKTTLDLQ